MRNLKEWEELTGEKIIYNDKVSIFIKHPNGYVSIEKREKGGLQIQFRKSLDHADIVVAEDIVVGGKIVSELTHNNYNGIQKIFLEFVDKI